MVSSLKRNTASSNLSRYLLWDLKFPAGGHFISSKRTGTSFLSTGIIENIFFKYCTRTWYLTFHWYTQYCIWILILNLTSRSVLISKCQHISFFTVHNAFLHRNIQSNPIFSNLKRQSNLSRYPRIPDKEVQLWLILSMHFKCVPDIVVLDKEVQLYLFNVNTHQ